MQSISLNLGELNLHLALVTRDVEEPGKPYLDWLVCDLKIRDQGFTGTVRWNVMPSELSRLADELERLHDRLPELGSVSFESVEPNLTLSFAIYATGAIGGQYGVRDFVHGPLLSGGITFDQSYVPRIVRDLRAFIMAATDAA